MLTAFVTGGAGFLGLNLVEQLIVNNWEVIAFDRAVPNKYLKKWGVKTIKGDLSDSRLCEQSIPENVDAVFHVAGNTGLWKLGNVQQTKDNVEGTRHMVSAALRRKVRRFIYTSSIVSYGHQSYRITEESPSIAHRSKINYFRTKRLAEQEVRQGISQGLDAVILNPSNIVGSYDYSGWSQLFILVAEGKLPGVIPPGKGSFCNAREVANAHISAFEKGECGHNYLLGGADATFLEFFQEIHRLLNREPPTKVTHAYLLKGIGVVFQLISYITGKEPDLTPEKASLVSAEHLCSSEKAKQELGYQEVSLNAMLTECYEWMIQEGLI